jgi:hypothetical protein
MRCIRVSAVPAMVLLALLLLVTLPAFGQAQTASLEGAALDSVTGTPVNGVRIILERQGKGTDYHGFTDGQGRFVLPGVVPGEYKLSGDRNGYVPAGSGLFDGDDDEGEPVSLAPGERRSGIELRMIPAAVIAGRVLNNLSEPVPGIVMFAARITYEGRRRKMAAAPYSLIATDDRGGYRLYGLPPGRYYLGADELKDLFVFSFGSSGTEDVDASDAPPKEHLGLQYYPGVPDPEQAIALELRAGEEMSGVDFRYDYTPLVSVRGRVAVPVFCPGKLSFHAEREIDTDQEYPIQVASTPDGSFEIRGLSPGSWRISAVATEKQTYCSTETTTVLVGPSGAGGVTLALRPRVDLAGVVRMEGEPDFRFQRAQLQFESLEDGDRGSWQIKADGGFAATLEPGHWSLAITGAPRNAFIKSARLGETDVLESGLNLTAGSPAGRLEVVLSAAGAQVEGAVFDRSGRPARGAIVVLAPEPRLRVHGRLFHEAAADSDGRFAFRGIAPGAYKLFAWSGLEGEAYRDPDFMRAYEERGEKIVVRENEAKQVCLKLIVR